MNKKILPSFFLYTRKFVFVFIKFLFIVLTWSYKKLTLLLVAINSNVRKFATYTKLKIKNQLEQLREWYLHSENVDKIRSFKNNLYIKIEKWLIRFFNLEHLQLDKAGISHVQLGRPSDLSLVILKVITILFVLLIVWAALAEVDDISHADGRVIPSAKMQVVENMEGGIVQSIEVRQGDRVSQGALLVTLSPAQFGSEFNSRNQQMMSLIAKSNRLRAEIDDRELKFTDEFKKLANEIVVLEVGEFNSRRSRQKADLMVFETQLRAALEELEVVTRLVERGLEPKLELIRNQQRVAEVRNKLDSLKKQFKAEAAAELAKTMADLAPLQKSMPAIEDKFDRTQVKSPVNGVVNRVLVTTTGGVVKPGEPIVEIVPSDDLLVVEAKINPKDIGFVKLGQKAKVKLTAYDYSIFGSIDGRIVNISADAVSNEERGQQQYFYLARIETNSSIMNSIGKKLPIIPGMQAQVDVITGQKTVLRYLLKPIIGVKENAFRER